MDDFTIHLNEQLKDPEFRKEYERTSGRYRVILEIIKLRNRFNLTQKDLAEKIGTTQSYISRVENGNVDIGMDFFYRILDCLGAEMKITIPRKKKITEKEPAI